MPKSPFLSILPAPQNLLLSNPESLSSGTIPTYQRICSKPILTRPSDGASRKIVEIEKTVRHLTDSSFLKAGDRVLDLGCGPGLYSSRLCLEGMKVTDVDISRLSIDYARSQAERRG